MNNRPSVPLVTRLPLNTQAGGTNKQSRNKNFAAKLRQVSGQTARTLQQTTNYMAPVVPGTAILSAGFGNVANNLSAEAGAGGGATLMNPEGGDIASRFGSMQENMMSRSMEFLAVQQQVQQRSEEFTMKSNIAKVDHETKKNSISNMR